MAKCPECGKNHQTQQTARQCMSKWNFSMIADCILEKVHKPSQEELKMKEYFNRLPDGLDRIIKRNLKKS